MDLFQAILSSSQVDEIRRRGYTPYQLCDRSYLFEATKEQMAGLFADGKILKYEKSPFPRSEFRREYEYLGDFPTGSNVFFDLRLKESDENCSYTLSGDLPAGLVFMNGLLYGRAQERTDIVHLTVAARKGGVERAKSFMIRFFTDINRASTFSKDEFLTAGCGKALIDYDPQMTHYRHIQLPLPPPVEPRIAARNAALWAREQAGNLPIVLFSSGGIDSQCMIQAFIDAGVEFKCVFVSDTFGTNHKVDLHYFRKFIEHRPVPHEIVPFEFARFIENYEYVPMAHRYRFNNPEYGILLHMMDMFPDVYPVYAGRPIGASPHSESSDVLSLCGDENLSKARYLERNGRKGCIEFISCTAELVSSFLEMPSIRNHGFGLNWNYDDKIVLLKEAGFDVTHAPPIKGTGFEDLIDRFKNDDFGNTLWTHHRGPLKYLYPNPVRRNGIGLRHGQITADPILRAFDDGFSYSYVTSNDVGKFH